MELYRAHMREVAAEDTDRLPTQGDMGHSWDTVDKKGVGLMGMWVLVRP